MPREQLSEKPGEICQNRAYEAERRERIPKQLLAAISDVKTGSWDTERQENFAWPWTVNSDGEGRYFPTKAQTMAVVKRLQAEGVENIDVGCMRVKGPALSSGRLRLARGSV